MTKAPIVRFVAVAVALAALVATALGAAAPGAGARTAPPRPNAVPGGLVPGEQPQLGCAGDGVCIVKDTGGPSCTGYTSQTTPPATIRVLVHGSPDRIVTVDFRTYVQSVLPNEWIPSWDGEALKAGAVAVKSYAWFWVTHFGGYYQTRSACFDVTDDTSFQVYRAGSATTRTTDAVNASWATAARTGGRIMQATYQAYFSSAGEACGSGASRGSMSQWGSQACAEAGWNYARIVEAYYPSGLQLATARQLHTLDDFTYNQRSTIACFDGTHTWAIDDDYGTRDGFGLAGDIPTVRNTGDGLAQISVWRPSTGAWYVANNSGKVGWKVSYGRQGDVPVQAHYHGAAAPTDLAVFRPSTGEWFIRGRSTPTRFGQRGDVPVPADYTGDGVADLAVWRPSTGQWFVQGAATLPWGVAGDIPAPADYNGDGRVDVAVYRPSTNQFFVRGTASVQWGAPGDVPVSGDFTGDGHADLVVYRPSTKQWFVRGRSPITFAACGGRPIGAAPAHN